MPQSQCYLMYCLTDKNPHPQASTCCIREKDSPCLKDLENDPAVTGATEKLKLVCNDVAYLREDSLRAQGILGVNYYEESDTHNVLQEEESQSSAQFQLPSLEDPISLGEPTSFSQEAPQTHNLQQDHEAFKKLTFEAACRAIIADRKVVLATGPFFSVMEIMTTLHQAVYISPDHLIRVESKARSLPGDVFYNLVKDIVLESDFEGYKNFMVMIKGALCAVLHSSQGRVDTILDQMSDLQSSFKALNHEASAIIATHQDTTESLRLSINELASTQKSMQSFIELQNITIREQTQASSLPLRLINQSIPSPSPPVAPVSVSTQDVINRSKFLIRYCDQVLIPLDDHAIINKEDLFIVNPTWKNSHDEATVAFFTFLCNQKKAPMNIYILAFPLYFILECYQRAQAKESACPDILDEMLQMMFKNLRSSSPRQHFKMEKGSKEHISSRFPDPIKRNP